MRRTLALALAVGLFLAGCGGSDDDRKPKNAAGGSTGSSTGPAPSSTGPEPTSCPNGAQLIEAVEIPGVHSDPVRVPEATISGKKIPAVTIPGVDIPAERVPAQCVEHKPAPGGCLGAVTIPGTTIPGVTIPGVRIPGVEAPGIHLQPVERSAVSRSAVTRGAVTRNEVCQTKPTKEGQLVDAVVRDALVRDALVRDALVRDALVRDAACNDKGECIPAVSVPAVGVEAVGIQAVGVEAAALQAYVAGPAQVLKGDDKIAYNIEADVLFDFGKADIKPEAANGLAELVQSIRKEVPSGAPIQVDGHTDSKGDPASNKKLSERRAQAIVDWLATKGGIDRSRLKATGYGETKPAAPNAKPDGSDDPKGRAKNRRVVISATHS